MKFLLHKILLTRAEEKSGIEVLRSGMLAQGHKLLVLKRVCELCDAGTLWP